MKKLAVIVMYLLFFCGIGNNSVMAQESDIVIIQQIRGAEKCCRAGTIEMINELMQNQTIQALPLAWALRYDALIDDGIKQKVATVPHNHDVGLLLEVTPQFASDSGVIYNGSPSENDWYSARNSQLIGYTQEQRKALLDHLFETFRKSFGHYPVFTVSWMIDAWSLNYIRNTFGVRVHELTKEQRETDSYTLSGGVFNLPYFPTREHPLIPASSTRQPLDLLIVRQTISDLDSNYGSLKSYFTSQPNDYLQNPSSQGFSYFSYLLDEVGKQSEDARFAVVGLENSQEWVRYKEEYVRQLEYVARLAEEKKLLPLTPFAVYQKYAKSNPPFRLLKSHNFPETGALWFFSGSYRARLEIINEKVVLTDFRVYGNFQDPYAQAAAPLSRGYWIVPYLVDGAMQQEVTEDSKKANGNSHFGIVVGGRVERVEEKEGDVSIVTSDGTVDLNPQFITTTVTNAAFLPPIDMSFTDLWQSSDDFYVQFPQHPRFVLKKETERLDLGWENRQLEPVILASLYKEASLWKLIPNSHLNQLQLDSLDTIWQPDMARIPADPQKTIYFWHNFEAIAGKSPIRLFISPQTIYLRPAVLRQLQAKIESNNPIVMHIPEQFDKKLEPILIDFTADEPTEGNIQLIIDGNLLPKTEISFVTDCRLNIAICVGQPDQLRGYTRILIRNKLDEVKKIYEQLADNARSKIQEYMNILNRYINTLLPTQKKAV